MCICWWDGDESEEEEEEEEEKEEDDVHNYDRLVKYTFTLVHS